MAISKPSTKARSKTPRKTPSISNYFGPASASKTSTSASASKPKPRPNASILSYFKKAADEELFYGDTGLVGRSGTEGEDEDEGGLDGAGNWEALPAAQEKSRFNEVVAPAKRRKLSCDEKAKRDEGDRENENRGIEGLPSSTVPSNQGPGEESSKRKGLQPSTLQIPQKTRPRRRVANNPFLDDSSDSDDDGDGGDNDNDNDRDNGSDDRPASDARNRSSTPPTTSRPSPIETAASRPFEGAAAGGGVRTAPSTLSRQDILSGAQCENGMLVRRGSPNPTTSKKGPNSTALETEEEERSDNGPDDFGLDDADMEGMDALFDDPEADDLITEEGEELREMRYMREQALLEAEEAGEPGDEAAAHELGPDDAMTASCPICNGSLAGMNTTQATEHVNACLDGIPIPISPPDGHPIPIRPPDGVETKKEDGPAETGGNKKRLSRAAIARPGQANPITLGRFITTDTTSKAVAPTAGPFDPATTTAFTRLMSGHAEDAAWATAAATEQASRGKQAYQRTCPFYKIMPGMNICVDAFRYGKVEGCSAYFLSHFHSDHYIGLTASWSHGPIYCSKVTGSLVRTQLRTAARFVVELDFEVETSIPGTPGVTVTMIPANHCPGSSMFLFERSSGTGTGGKKVRILHCGDFRACPMHVEHPQLRADVVVKAATGKTGATGKTRQQRIDVCYLDTTYLNPRYSFPPQEDVSRTCAEVCAMLNQALKEGREDEWDDLLRRREGGPPKGLGPASKFFVVGGRNTSQAKGGDSSKVEIVKKEEGADAEADNQHSANAFTVLGQPKPKPANNINNNNNRLLVVCGTYSIGKERICKSIAQAMGTKIFASPHKQRVVRQLDDPELAGLMTDDPREGQVHMQMLAEMRAETLAEYLDKYRAHFGRVVGFRPSGWTFRPGSGVGNGGGGSRRGMAAAAGEATAGTRAQKTTAAVAAAGSTGSPLTMITSTGGGGGGGGGAIPNVSANLAPGSVATTQLLHGPRWRPRFAACDLVPQRGSGDWRDAMCFGVPYSEHSSFRELALFLMALRVERVVPTVNVGSEPSRRRMKAWTDRWLSERRKGGVLTVLRGGEVAAEAEAEAEVDGGSSGVIREGKRKAERDDKPVVLWEGKDGKGGHVYW